MRVVVTGGTGLIGSSLTRALLADGHTVTVLTRNIAHARAKLPPDADTVAWNAKASGDWETALDGADAVVNLAGESIAGGLWTAQRKRRIRASRIDATRAIVAALAQPGRPRVLVNGSAIGYYGDAGSIPLPESAPGGSDFLASVVQDWEREASAAEQHDVRVVFVRTGIVLANGGFLTPIVLPFKFFLGGTMGRADQWVSWIHIDDEVGIIRLALESADLTGPLNAAGPAPVTMEVFCRTIGHVLGRPSWLPGAAIGMRLILGELSTVALASQKVIPEAARHAGYSFHYSNHEDALRVILSA